MNTPRIYTEIHAVIQPNGYSEGWLAGAMATAAQKVVSKSLAAATP